MSNPHLFLLQIFEKELNIFRAYSNSQYIRSPFLSHLIFKRNSLCMSFVRLANQWRCIFWERSLYSFCGQSLRTHNSHQWSMSQVPHADNCVWNEITWWNLRFFSISSIYFLDPFHYTGCGTRPTGSSRIQDGYQSTIDEAPWMIGVCRHHNEGLRLLCTGFIVTAYNAITATQCVSQRWRLPQRFRLT